MSRLFNFQCIAYSESKPDLFINGDHDVSLPDSRRDIRSVDSQDEVTVLAGDA